MSVLREFRIASLWLAHLRLRCLGLAPVFVKIALFAARRLTDLHDAIGHGQHVLGAQDGVCQSMTVQKDDGVEKLCRVSEASNGYLSCLT